MIWNTNPCSPTTAEALSRGLQVGRVTAELLTQRGFTDSATAEAFLRPRLADLDDPFAIANLLAAAERLITAIRGRESVAVLGDYDVDGVTSTSLLVQALRTFGLDPQFFVPRRLVEGYGLTMAAVERVLSIGQPSLFIALDCGTNSVAEVAYLRARGIDVIVVDHHQSRHAVPTDCLVVNPHLEAGADQPWRNLCTVGLVFKLVHGLVKRLRQLGDATAEAFSLKECLDFVALGTVADLVPLRAENRILCRHGLRRLANTTRRGLQALFEVSGLQLGQDVQPPDISFRLGPRINACGRLNDAVEPVKLFLSDDTADCLEAAQRLDAFNRERQAIEREMVQEATAWVGDVAPEQESIVVAGADWHPGVVGIVAGKLARDFQRPSIALGRDGPNYVGSGRSCRGIDLQAVLTTCDQYLLEWGGHPMAVGVTIAIDQLEPFRAAFEAAVRAFRAHSPSIPEGSVTIDAWIDIDELSPELLLEIDGLRPFGEGNPEPILGVRRAVLRYPASPFGNGNVRFRLPLADGRLLSVVGWRLGENPPPAGQPLDFAAKFNRYTYNGQSYPQLELLHWRPSEPTSR